MRAGIGFVAPLKGQQCGQLNYGVCAFWELLRYVDVKRVNDPDYTQDIVFFQKHSLAQYRGGETWFLSHFFATFVV